MESLPTEILTLILSHLSLSSKIHLSLTSKTLQSLVIHHTLWTEISFCTSRSNHLDLISYTLSYILPHAGYNLTHINLSGTGDAFGDVQFCRLVRFTPKVLSIVVSGSSVTKVGIEFLFKSESCTRLKSLELVNVAGIDDATLALIGKGASQLSQLDLSVYSTDSLFTDVGLQSLVSCCPHLTKLVCIGSHSLTNAALLDLARFCPLLTHLDFSGAFLVSNQGVQSLLKKCPRLETVCFSYCWRLTDDLFDFVRTDSCPALQLKELGLSFCYQLSDQLISDLERIPTLKVLNVSYCASISMEAKFRLVQKGVYVS